MYSEYRAICITNLAIPMNACVRSQVPVHGAGVHRGGGVLHPPEESRALRPHDREVLRGTNNNIPGLHARPRLHISGLEAGKNQSESCSVRSTSTVS